MIQAGSERLENGVSVGEIAAGAARVYRAVKTGGPAPDEVATPRWHAVAEAGVALYLESASGNKEMKVTDLAALLRQHHTGDTDAPFDQLPGAERTAWEAVARFVCWATQMDGDGGNTLGEGEDYYVAKGDQTIQERGYTREQ